MKRAVIMGDPSCFSIKGGGNPHTRDVWGRRKPVDAELAVRQWHALADTLTGYGIKVFVAPPQPAWPGLVYPANAGFLYPLDANVPIRRKTFYLSNLLPSRAGERMHYQAMLHGLGFQTGSLPLRFEGEADFFPVCRSYVFTTGKIERQRFVPRWGWPPWKRVYGFRSDVRLKRTLEEIVAPREVLSVVLVKEAHYHGDTVFCAFGRAKDHLLVYEQGLHPDSLAYLRGRMGDRLIPLSEQDARSYAANSFCCVGKGGCFLFVPKGVSDALLKEIEARDTTPVPVDVSEFLKKGGGSVKCMIGDLGNLPEESGTPDAVQAFRKRHLYKG